MQRKNPAMNPMLMARTRDGQPQAPVSPTLKGKEAKHNVKQGAAARSNNSASRGGYMRTPVQLTKPKSKGKIAPNDILALPQGM